MAAGCLCMLANVAGGWARLEEILSVVFYYYITNIVCLLITRAREPRMLKYRYVAHCAALN